MVVFGVVVGTAETRVQDHCPSFPDRGLTISMTGFSVQRQKHYIVCTSLQDPEVPPRTAPKKFSHKVWANIEVGTVITHMPCVSAIVFCAPAEARKLT